MTFNFLWARLYFFWLVTNFLLIFKTYPCFIWVSKWISGPRVKTIPKKPHILSYSNIMTNNSISKILVFPPFVKFIANNQRVWTWTQTVLFHHTMSFPLPSFYCLIIVLFTTSPITSIYCLFGFIKMKSFFFFLTFILFRSQFSEYSIVSPLQVFMTSNFLFLHFPLALNVVKVKWVPEQPAQI